MKIVILTVLFFALSACSKKPSSRSDFKFVIDQRSLEVGISGGAFVETLDLATNQRSLLKLDSTNTALIPHGKYNLTLVAFAGPGDRMGIMSCGLMTGAIFDSPDTTLTINMNTVNCSQPAYSSAILAIKKDQIAKWDLDQWDLSHWGP